MLLRAVISKELGKIKMQPPKVTVTAEARHHQLMILLESGTLNREDNELMLRGSNTGSRALLNATYLYIVSAHLVALWGAPSFPQAVQPVFVSVLEGRLKKAYTRLERVVAAVNEGTADINCKENTQIERTVDTLHTLIYESAAEGFAQMSGGVSYCLPVKPTNLH